MFTCFLTTSNDYSGKVGGLESEYKRAQKTYIPQSEVKRVLLKTFSVLPISIPTCPLHAFLRTILRAVFILFPPSFCLVWICLLPGTTQMLSAFPC